MHHYVSFESLKTAFIHFNLLILYAIIILVTNRSSLDPRLGRRQRPAFPRIRQPRPLIRSSFRRGLEDGPIMASHAEKRRHKRKRLMRFHGSVGALTFATGGPSERTCCFKTLSSRCAARSTPLCRESKKRQGFLLPFQERKRIIIIKRMNN